MTEQNQMNDVMVQQPQPQQQPQQQAQPQYAPQQPQQVQPQAQPQPNVPPVPMQMPALPITDPVVAALVGMGNAITGRIAAPPDHSVNWGSVVQFGMKAVITTVGVATGAAAVYFIRAAANPNPSTDS